MSDLLKAIDPSDITVDKDGNVTYKNERLRAAIASVAANKVIPAADNFGQCTNSSICSGANNNCNNTGNCSGADNFGQCTVGTSGPPS